MDAVLSPPTTEEDPSPRGDAVGDTLGATGPQQFAGDAAPATGDTDTATTRHATSPGVATADNGDASQQSASRQTTGDTGHGDATSALTVRGTEQPEALRQRSFSLPDSLFHRMRSAVFYTQSKPDGYWNMSELVRAAVGQEVARLEAAHNSGRPFPPVEKLRTGPGPAGAARGAQIRAEKRRQSNREAAPEASPGDRSQ